MTDKISGYTIAERLNFYSIIVDIFQSLVAKMTDGGGTNSRVKIVLLKPNDLGETEATTPFRRFCSQTTLHGWSYLGNPRLSFGRKLLWSLMILTALGTASYFIHWFINGFLEHDVSTTIESTTAPLSEVHFPAVTICNDNQIRRSFLTDLRIYDDLKLSLKFAQQYILGHDNKLSEEDKVRVEAVLDRPEFKKMQKSYLVGKIGGKPESKLLMKRNFENMYFSSIVYVPRYDEVT